MDHDVIAIKEAINKTFYNQDFKNSLKDLKNPYGDGFAAKRIVDILEQIELNQSLIQKEICYDIKV